MAQINACGIQAAATQKDVVYWTLNWRKGGGSKRMLEVSKSERFYQQEYCGCVYSLRDTNAWRSKNGKDKIVIGQKYYGDDDNKPDV